MVSRSSGCGIGVVEIQGHEVWELRAPRASGLRARGVQGSAASCAIWVCGNLSSGTDLETSVDEIGTLRGRGDSM